MSTQRITLTGWKAVPAILVVLAFVGFRYYTTRQALDTAGREYLQEWIAMELRSPILADETTSLEERGAAVLGAGNVTIKTLTGFGSLDDLVVKVELEPNSELPPGTELVRYYRLEYGTFTGWTHRANASALMYYMAIF